MIALGFVVLAVWIGLIATGFWTCAARDENVALAAPGQWPEVVAVVPARDEADVIARSIGSLIAQDYPGAFRIILVDDNSSDGTGDIARAIASDRLTVLTGACLPAGWTGKLWAVEQGIAAAQSDGAAPRYLWLTDADIDHAPDTLVRLVEIAAAGDKRLVSFMAQLSCETAAEKLLIPAFIWFFMMLYPFNWVNRRGAIADRIAGAAGGCVLVEAAALGDAGGIAAMRGALIDDCTLGRMIKRQGPIWLGLTERSRSIRPYRGVGEIGAMITRSAYAQLRYNPALLVVAVAGLAVVFGGPLVCAVSGQPVPRFCGLVACGLALGSYAPILTFYRRAPVWGLALPLVAVFYVGCTLWSALAWYRGRGGMWKGRAQAAI